MPKSRSGTATRTNAMRPRPMVTFTLSKEAVARLAELAEERGESRSAVVDGLILGSALREVSLVGGDGDEA